MGITIGLYYNGARYLAAWLGRWTSADPIGIGADGPGLYNYTRGSPVNYTDPSGTSEKPYSKLTTAEKLEVGRPSKLDINSARQGLAAETDVESREIRAQQLQRLEQRLQDSGKLSTKQPDVISKGDGRLLSLQQPPPPKNPGMQFLEKKISNPVGNPMIAEHAIDAVLTYPKIAKPLGLFLISTAANDRDPALGQGLAMFLFGRAAVAPAAPSNDTSTSLRKIAELEQRVYTTETLAPGRGAMRAEKWAASWQPASLANAVERFAPGSVPLPSGSKRIYTNPKTGIQVIHDTEGNYFRISDPKVGGKRPYLDIDGKNANNALIDGKQRGRNQAVLPPLGN